MSHVVAHEDICFVDQQVLTEVCEELGCTYNPGKSDWLYYGEWRNDYHADDAAYKHGINPKDYGKNATGGVISLKGDAHAYEVGLYPHPSGQGLMPVYDFFGEQGRRIRDALGKKLEKLKGKYAEYAIRKQARAGGYSVQRKVTPEGHVQLIAEPR